MDAPRLHHIGYVVPSIAEGLERWESALFVRSVSARYADDIQKATVLFLELPDGVRLELVEPLTSDSPVSGFLAKGGGLHHLCFEVGSLAQQIQHMRRQHAVLVRRPQPAVAFGGRHIAWMMTRERMLVEYLENNPLAVADEAV
jgi:methylmalonyl-CoA/ethylmalonyl-CoA epimerase